MRSNPLLKIMKKILFAIVVFSITLSSCTVINTTHQFYHHGTDAIKTNADFVYVKYNLVGRSATKYYPNRIRREQGVVRNGLIADAKRNLNLLYQLEKNQAFANMTIDILTTTKGKSSPNGVFADEITLEAVISVDVIEFVD